MPTLELNPTNVREFYGAPSGVGPARSFALDITTGNLYYTADGTGIWTLVAATGAGTVTSIATGDGLTGGPITATGTVSATSALINDSIAYAADAGSTDTYAITLSPVPLAYVIGARYRFKANTANTGAATINVNTLGAKSIVKVAGGITTALADNDIRAGQIVDLVYDGTNMQMQSLLGNAPSSGLTVGTTPITSGVDGRVLFQGTGAVLGEDSALNWDPTNDLLKVGGSPNTPLSGLFIGPDESLLPADIQGWTSGKVLITNDNAVSGTGLVIEVAGSVAKPYATGIAIVTYSDQANTGSYGLTADSYYAANAGASVAGKFTSSLSAGTGSEVHTLELYTAVDTVTATELAAIWVGLPNISGGGSATNYFGLYNSAVGGKATNAYSFWSDEAGVFRIRSDNTFDSVYQAIPALYNPQVTKYTPGAANYERIVLAQWNGNVAEIGTEKGGTGTLRSLRFIGKDVTVPSVITTSVAVGSLPASPVEGQRAFVNDSNAASFTLGIGAIVANGGTTKVPVVYDGTDWRIG